MASLQGIAEASPEVEGTLTQSQVAKGGDEPDHTEESDAAPVGSCADALTAEEEAKCREATQ